MAALVQTFRDMGQARLAAMGAAALLLIGVFIFISMRFSTPSYSPLYSGLEMEDSSQIAAALDKQNVPYQLQANGSQILVPSDQVLKVRLNLAGQGMPAGGSVVGYEIFDRSEALGTSNFVLNVNMLRALEGELARTIGSFSQVEKARVHLVVPKRELFSREKQEPTASVVLKLRGSELGKNEVAAIRNLVATAVPGLKVSAITLVDSRGRMLAKGGSESGDIGLNAEDSSEYRIAYETRAKNTVESLLEQSLGVGKVKATVSADIDFDRVVTNSEKYDPEGQVVRSVQTGEEKEAANDSESGAAGNTSVSNNLPDAQGSAAGGKGPSSARNTQSTNETTNYEISKTVENHVKESGTVKRLSVAVLVDGTYTTDAEGKQTYTPRTDEELKQLESVAKTAVGFNESRGDEVTVVNMPFQTQAVEEIAESPLDWLKNDMQGIIQTLVLGGVSILAILLILRPLVNRIIESSPSPAREPALSSEPMTALAGPSGSMPRLASPGASSSSGMLSDAGEDEDMLINLQRVEGRIKSSSIRKINDIVEQHPEETMNVLRQWTFKEY